MREYGAMQRDGRKKGARAGWNSRDFKSLYYIIGGFGELH